MLSDWRALHFGVALLSHDPSHGHQRPARQQQWREHAEDALLELCALTEAMRDVSERYFGGHAVLFPQATGGLAFCLEAVQRLIETRNDDLRFARRRRSRARVKGELIDVAAIKATAAEAATLLAAEIVALAKSEAHTLVGEQDAAADAVRPLVVPAGA